MYKAAKAGQELVMTLIRFTLYRKYAWSLVETGELFPLGEYLQYVKEGAGGDNAGESDGEIEKNGAVED